MRMSCNGCRVLRKGCSEGCTIRPCLQWIKSPESQAHATVFLAKFYGRAGLINLINSGPGQLRPEIFRSLLYEACGRIVNPVYGSVGLIWSGSWETVEAAVGAVLRGETIVPISCKDAAATPVPHTMCDIRHLSKAGPELELRKVSKRLRTRFEHTAKPSKVASLSEAVPEPEPEPSHHSSKPGLMEPMCFRDGAQCEVSVDTGEVASHVSEGEPGPAVSCEDVSLDLTLGFGFEPARRDGSQVQSKLIKRCESSSGGRAGACFLNLELQLSAIELG